MCAAGSATRVTTQRDVEPGSTEPLRLVLHAGGVIEGVLRDRDGVALTESALWLFGTVNADGTKVPMRTGRTDASGRLRVDGLDAVPYRVYAVHGDVGTGVFDEPISPGETRNGIHFEAPPRE